MGCIHLSLHFGHSHPNVGCSKFSVGIKMISECMEVFGSPVLMKCHAIPPDLSKPVQILGSVKYSCWVIPIVTLAKRVGKTPRISADYSITLNEVLKHSSCVIPEPEDIFKQSRDSKSFSRLEVKHIFSPTGFTWWAVKCIYNYKYAFWIISVIFHLVILTALFQSADDFIISGFQVDVSYQDDSIFHTTNQTLHGERSCLLLECFFAWNVRVNAHQYNFATTQFTCLGFWIDERGFRPHLNLLFAFPHVDAHCRSPNFV